MSTLAKAEEISHNRSARAKELRAKGKKIMGYLCCNVPLEMMRAVDIIPYRILGNVEEPVTLADAHLETCLCPFIRSCFDIAMKGEYDFLDGWVIPHSCDNVAATYHLFRYYLSPPYCHFLDVPHVIHLGSHKFFKEEMLFLKRDLEQLAGKEISPQALNEAIKLYNENRDLVRELYELRKEDPPLVSGSEMTQIMVAAMSLPVEECNEWLRSVVKEVKERKDGPEKKAARILIWGGPIDNPGFIRLVEESGANVVVDDQCMGTRHFFADVEITEDPLDGLVLRYLDKIQCPRTCRGEEATTYKGNLGQRFSYILDYARDFKANGVILQILRFCDSHAYELPDLRDYLREAGLPVLALDHEYSLSAIGPLKTRIQAFVEMIGSK